MTKGLTIAEAVARCGLPESTLRYWERIGLVRPVARDESSGHRRYGEDEVTLLETLANLRAVGLSIEDMRAYLRQHELGDAAAAEQRALFQAHSERLAAEMANLELRQRYLELKVEYWTRSRGRRSRRRRGCGGRAAPHHPKDQPTRAGIMTERITSPFDFYSTAADVVADADLHGRRAIVTGAASGIGVETARALASAGATVLIAARNLDAADAGRSTRSATTRAMPMSRSLNST